MTECPIPEKALAQHIAIVGKTGSGKTHTAKACAEWLLRQGARVCIIARHPLGGA
jgi:DNA helicase HerA-like ATPase